MKDIYILEIMAGIVAAVAILILGGQWYWAGIFGLLAPLCLILFTLGWQATKAKRKRATDGRL